MKYCEKCGCWYEQRDCPCCEGGDIVSVMNKAKSMIMFTQDSPMGLAIKKVGVKPNLIAAAPELLELLKDINKWLNLHLSLGHIDAGTVNRDGDLVSQIRAAIAKVEGR